MSGENRVVLSCEGVAPLTSAAAQNDVQKMQIGEIFRSFGSFYLSFGKTIDGGEERSWWGGSQTFFFFFLCLPWLCSLLLQHCRGGEAFRDRV